MGSNFFGTMYCSIIHEGLHIYVHETCQGSTITYSVKLKLVNFRASIHSKKYSIYIEGLSMSRNMCLG
jgi:hypothetical protein